MFYKFANTLVIFPGDIEPNGWSKLWPKIKTKIENLVNNSTYRILIAPHHGRESGFCQEMFEALRPSFCIVSDEHGMAPTDRRFRESPEGITFNNGTSIKYYSTKTDGRAKIVIGPQGLKSLNND